MSLKLITAKSCSGAPNLPAEKFAAVTPGMTSTLTSRIFTYDLK